MEKRRKFAQFFSRKRFTSEGCEELWGIEEVLSKKCFESMYIVDMNTAMSRYITSLGNGRAPTSSGEGRGKPNPSSGLRETGDIVYRKYPIQIFFLKNIYNIKSALLERMLFIQGHTITPLPHLLVRNNLDSL